MARAVAAKLNVPVTVDNRPRGNTIIGAELAAKAAPDGYTLFPIDSTLAMKDRMWGTRWEPRSPR